MSKHGGFLTPKALSVRMKAKGLQRLRWYCQMCSKQCRDENGFKCHTQSEAHLRQMGLFAEDAAAFIDAFSRRFVDGFVELLKRKGGRRVKANHVYTAYIADKEHVHMNSTKWDTLTSFVSFLGKSGLAEVDQDEEGNWWLRYIDRDPRVLARQEERARTEGRERSAEDAERRRIEAQIEAAVARRREEEEAAHDSTGDGEAEQREDREARARDAELNRDGQPLRLALLPPPAPTAGPRSTNALLAAAAKGAAPTPLLAVSSGEKRRHSALEAIVQEEEEKRQRRQRAPAASPLSAAQAFPSPSSWLCPGLVVRLLSRALHSGALYRQKGCVLSVDAEGRVATVSTLPPSSPALVVQVERRELETVIPALGQEVLLVRGADKGRRATLLRLSEEQETCSVRMLDDGRQQDGVELAAVCKLADALQ